MLPGLAKPADTRREVHITADGLLVAPSLHYPDCSLAPSILKRTQKIMTRHLLAALSIVFLATSRLPAQDYVWLEGEKPAAINVKPLIAGWGNKQFLSGGQWLQVSIDAGK